MININRADIDDFIQIAGIGQGKAFNIIKYRKENNGFESMEELKQVKGIADKLFKMIKPELTLGDDQSTAEKVKITVNIQDHGIENPDEMHLVGEMNNWDPKDKTYILKEKENGYWSNDFNLDAGTEYKIMYDSTSWEDNNYFGDNGGNLKIKK